MKTLIIYYSMSGNTRQTAETIADKLKRKGSEVDLIEIKPQKAYPDKGAQKYIWGGRAAMMGAAPKLESYDFDPEQYDTVLIGSPIWASRVAPPINSFIKENISQIKSKKLGFFVCYSGGGADKALDRVKKQIKEGKPVSELILIDPKDKPDPDNDKLIDGFIESIES